MLTCIHAYMLICLICLHSYMHACVHAYTLKIIEKRMICKPYSQSVSSVVQYQQALQSIESPQKSVRSP